MHSIDEHIIEKWLSGELSEAERDALEKHPDFPEIQRIMDASASWEAPAFDEQKLWDRFEAKVKQEEQAAPQQEKVRKFPIQYVALGLAAGIAILFFIFFPGVAISEVKTIQAKAGQTEEAQLPDGSIVTLNAVSAIAYDEANWESDRTVILKGEAAFAVKKGETFTVNTTQGKVEVLGTKFNVWAREEGLEVFCYEGKVRVTASNGDEVILTAGEKGELVDNQLLESKVAERNQPQWQQKKLVLINGTRARAVAELEWHYGIEIDASAFENEPFYATEIPLDNLETALKILSNNGKVIQLSPKQVKLEKME